MPFSVAERAVMKTEKQCSRIWVIRTTLNGEVIEFAGKNPNQAVQVMARAVNQQNTVKSA